MVLRGQTHAPGESLNMAVSKDSRTTARAQIPDFPQGRHPCQQFSNVISYRVPVHPCRQPTQGAETAQVVRVIPIHLKD